ncbi:MAG: NOB1 family endonuclease [Candidatus Bathyarchaeia archaeon]
MVRERAIILDASAFISGFDPFSVEDKQYSVPTVGKELSEGSLPHLRFETAAEMGRLKVLEPDPVFMEKAKESSREAGDARFLSEADLQILALAAQLREGGFDPSIVTDDYSIQNVAEKMGLKFSPLATFGIRFYLRWLLYCPACYKKYPPDYRFKQCEVCGTTLKRKPLRKTRIR